MYNPIRIGEFLRRKKVPIHLNPEEVYTLLTVKLHHKGVVQREKKKGAQIGSNMYKVAKGDFILSGIDARNGAFGIVPAELDGAIVTNDFWCFSIDETKVKRDFFFWLTTTPLFLDACQKSSKGETQRIRLQKDLFYDFEFHFPSVKDQDEFLSSFRTSEKCLLELTDETNYQKELLRKLRQNILQEAIEGKLTVGWREQTPVRTGDPRFDAEALLSNIMVEKKKLIAEGKTKKAKALSPVKFEEVPFELPEGWIWCRLGEVGFINPRNYIDDNLSVGFCAMPLISSKFGESPRFERRTWKTVKTGYTHFANNDIAVAKITPCFENSKACVFSGLPNGYGAGTTELHVLRPVLINAFYVYIYVKTSAFLLSGEKLMTGTVGQKRVPTEYFENALLPLPPLTEQQVIVEFVEKFLAMVDEMEKQVNERKGQSDQLMQAVLREAFEIDK